MVSAWYLSTYITTGEYGGRNSESIPPKGPIKNKLTQTRFRLSQDQTQKSFAFKANVITHKAFCWMFLCLRRIQSPV